MSILHMEVGMIERGIGNFDEFEKTYGKGCGIN